MLARLRTALFDAYARSVPARRREHSGRAASAAMTDIEKLEFFYAHTVAQIGAALTVFAGATAVALAVMPSAALVMLAGAVAVALTAWAGAGPSRRVGARAAGARGPIGATGRCPGALREVLAYGLRWRVVQEAIAGTRRSASVARHREVIAHLLDGMRELILTAVVIGVIASTLAWGAAGRRRTGAAPRRRHARGRPASPRWRMPRTPSRSCIPSSRRPSAWVRDPAPAGGVSVDDPCLFRADRWACASRGSRSHTTIAPRC